jgi:hypothetical protein
MGGQGGNFFKVIKNNHLPSLVGTQVAVFLLLEKI